MKRFVVLLLALPLLYGCTASFKADMGSYGKTHKIRMYNGGVLVAEWYSVGKVASLSDSDGWQFMDRETEKLVRVGGDVIIEVID